MDTAGPTSRLERQHARARRSASTSLERDYVPPSTDQILAIARARRRMRPTPEHDQAPGLAHPLPFTLTDLLPPERVLFLRVSAGTTAFTRRKAVRAWQHKLRATREHAHTDTGRATPTRVRDQRATAMTARERDAAYEALPAPAAALYRQLGACPISWFDIDMLAVLIDLDAPAAERLTERLLERGLLERDADGFALGPHGHLHAWVKAEASESEQRDLDAAGLDRLLAFLRDTAGTAARLIAPGRAPLWERDEPHAPGAAPFLLLDEQAALEWVDTRTGVYLDVIRFAFADQRYALVCDLVYWLWPLWLRRRRTGPLTEALTLALAAAQLAYSERATAGMLIALADAARTLNAAAAYRYARHAAAHCEQTGDSAGLAAALSSLGSTLLDTGQIDQADSCFRDAHALHATLGQPRGVALARRGRGLIALERGDAETAVELLDDAHRALAQVGDRHEAALTLALHARALAADGDVRHALLELDLAAGVLREMRATHGEAAVLSTRADLLAEAGFETQARQARAKALSLRSAAVPCADAQDAESGDAC
jgi:tetratricopeptide (TPR) repeat protein